MESCSNTALRIEAPLYLWEEAVSRAHWLRNLLTSSRVEWKIPFKLWYGTKPNLSLLLKFGQPGVRL